LNEINPRPFFNISVKKGSWVNFIQYRSKLILKNGENFVKFKTDIPQSQMIIFKDLKLYYKIMPFPVFFLTTYIRAKMSIPRLSINKNIFGGKKFFAADGVVSTIPPFFHRRRRRCRGKSKSTERLLSHFRRRQTLPSTPASTRQRGRERGESEREKEKRERNTFRNSKERER
jgi:hypothetical protein